MHHLVCFLGSPRQSASVYGPGQGPCMGLQRSTNNGSLLAASLVGGCWSSVAFVVELARGWLLLHAKVDRCLGVVRGKEWRDQFFFLSPCSIDQLYICGCSHTHTRAQRKHDERKAGGAPSDDRQATAATRPYLEGGAPCLLCVGEGRDRDELSSFALRVPYGPFNSMWGNQVSKIK